MKYIWTIMKKELARVFKDPRLAFVIFLFPGLMIFAMYSIMGNVMYNTEENYVVETVNMNTEVENIIRAAYPNISFNMNAISTIDEAKELISDGKADVAIIFDEDFSTEDSDLSNINIIYNAGSSTSSNAYSGICGCLEAYRGTLQSIKYGTNYKIFNLNTISSSDEKETMGQVYAMLLPFLIITFLFSGVTSVAPESIAGEKERGTIATLLVTPIKRGYLALGKIISLSILAVLSAISSFIGIILSLPKLMGAAAGNVDNIYGLGDYASVLAILIVTVLVLVSIVSLLSCIAKNTKEASMLTLPLMLISMGIGISSMLGATSSSNQFVYIIPIYNSIQILTQIFTFSLNTTSFIITICSNIVYTGLMILLLTKMFDNEKIMFSK